MSLVCYAQESATYQGDDRFTVRMCLEFYIGANTFAKRDVVVYLSVNGKDNFTVLTNQRLCATVCFLDVPEIFITVD